MSSNKTNDDTFRLESSCSNGSLISTSKCENQVIIWYCMDIGLMINMGKLIDQVEQVYLRMKTKI